MNPEIEELNSKVTYLLNEVERLKQQVAYLENIIKPK